MKLAHKKLVKVVYPKSICHHIDGEFKVFDRPIDEPNYRIIGSGRSAWEAWSNTYKAFSAALKRKANTNV